MPTSGTHITIVQRLALDLALQPLLGNPDPVAITTDPAAALKMRYACLGAVGPDILYAMADYSSELQDLENFLLKVQGTLSCLSEEMAAIDQYVSGVLDEITLDVTASLRQTTQLTMGVIRDQILTLIVEAGYNFWPVFEAKRQLDRPREEWYWADYLHYVRTGKFVRVLLEKSAGSPNLRAYALGYMTHYVVDVVGHPYVNQIVQAPFRLYWQRHHLVENFIDAYIWDRWHTLSPEPPAPTTEKQLADKVRVGPSAIGEGAPFTFSRLHDLIDVGGTRLGDPVDSIVGRICEKIRQGRFELGIAEDTEIPAPDDAEFRGWCDLIAESLREVYDDPRHPTNLEKIAAGLGTARSGGYPTGADIAGAYGMMRLVLKLSTEEEISEPVEPIITTDVQDVLAQLQASWQDLLDDVGDIPPFPVASSDGAITLESLLEAIKNAAEWLADVAEVVAQSVLDFVDDNIATVGTVVSERIKYALYLLNRALYAAYRALREVLVLSANAAPFTDELSVNRGTFRGYAGSWVTTV